LMQGAEDNIQICQPSTPAQHFHLLRRQVLRRIRKPLIVFTPKSLLRHPNATSALDEFTETGKFHRVLADNRVEPKATTRIFMCTGKMYYELEKTRHERKRDDIAIIRLEQLYPLADGHLKPALDGYADGTPVYWVQDEPENMGAWRYLRMRFGAELLGRFPLHRVSRSESASPATGSSGAHKIEHQRLMDDAFGP